VFFGSAKRGRQAQYMGQVYTKCLNVIGLVGNHPGPLAIVFCVLFIQHAKSIGRSKKDAQRIFDKYWEHIGPSGELLQVPETAILDG
jgi:hypothetical protein